MPITMAPQIPFADRVGQHPDVCAELQRCGMRTVRHGHSLSVGSCNSEERTCYRLFITMVIGDFI